MSQTMRSLQTVFMLCLIVELTGCQEPLAPAMQGKRVAAASHADSAMALDQNEQAPNPKVIPVVYVADAGASTGPKAPAAPVATEKKQPECLTLELGNGLLSALKLFTGH